jgi:hypothetical protein
VEEVQESDRELAVMVAPVLVAFILQCLRLRQ